MSLCVGVIKCYKNKICDICIYSSVPCALKMEEVNQSKVLHKQVREVVFDVYQHFQHKARAVEDEATHEVVCHSVVICQTHAVSDSRSENELRVRRNCYS